MIDAGLMGAVIPGFAPNEPITRAEVAVVLDRMLKQMWK
ncbi:S-layer homology domain-containing protein [Paenibacillus thiaminolyticus]|nr:S-layer homology domain-containing protein [Paenibacillus thiaminolyticus]WII40411.1 S-layer homology domain-containing protein [Paenibacillus thiaminolyticus]